MKIKFKQTKMPHVTNITFDFTHSRQLSKNLDLKHESSNRTYSHHQRLSYSSSNKPALQTTKNFNSSLLIKYNSFIPKNPNMKSVILAHDRQAKPIKSLQSAKQIQKKFPVRKILSKASTMGMFFRKDKVFEFENPQTELELFQNKSICSSMAKSHGSFFNKSKVYEQVKTDNSEHNQKMTRSSFKRYDMRNSLTSSTTSLQYRGNQQSLNIFKTKRQSNPLL